MKLISLIVKNAFLKIMRYSILNKFNESPIPHVNGYSILYIVTGKRRNRCYSYQ